MFKHRISFIGLLLVIFTSALFVIFSSFITAPVGLTSDVLKYTNQFRKSKGKQVLVMHDELNAIARKHSEDMARGRRAFGHGGYAQREAKVCRIFNSCTMAENVAYGAATGKDAVAQWKNSSSHRKNLLGNYKYIGIGVASDRRGRTYYTQIFVR